MIVEYQTFSLADLDARFSAGTVPIFEEIKGRTAGAWLAKDKEYWWASAFIKILLDSPWARWTGKEVMTAYGEDFRGRGQNLFSNKILPTRYPMDTYVKKAEVDDNLCFTLDYQFPSIMYGLIDDIRQVDDGILLGQMQYKWFWKKKRLFLGYFLLCCLESE